ncbi:carboxylesterase/lipase family protein [Saccharopolyspora griseoalba]|uniref:Carboxylic ester hydrolase n=1 Tax=Saccharopolyspora griseoalba TaxID=1431848 RepID=A0ABW2LET3_9PSEU
MDRVVRTEHGAVQGDSDGEVLSFKGVPYAAPLEGPRRFQAPATPVRWDGLRDATRFGSSVPQPAMLPGAPPVWRPGDDPDCLTVNVWTPDRGGHLPVMVWFHGGAYLGGTAAASGFDGTKLARAGVVVVTVNYRVGYEGFGWVEDAPNNRGILDQLAALRWVRDNIISFGGNPDSVTIFGESAGAVSVAALVAGSGRRGLFRRAIAQSPAAMYLDEDEARKVGELVTGSLGVPATTAGLVDTKAEDLHAAQQRAQDEMNRDRASWTNGVPYGVVFDGEVLSELPWVALRNGAAPAVDLITGYNRDEGSLFTADLPDDARDPDQLAAGLRIPPEMVAEYRAAHPGIGDRELHTLLLGDQLFRIPAVWTAEAHAAAGARSYLYQFSWESPQRGGALGACHGLDVPFTFGVADDPLARQLLGEDSADFEELSGALREAWVSFATTGDPGWPAHEPADRMARIFDVPISVASDPIAASREIWSRHFPRD